MSTIKIYDKDKQDWKKITSKLATSIFVVDTEGHYESSNVEGCLKEIGRDLAGKIDDVTVTEDNYLNFYCDGELRKSIQLPSGFGRAVCNEFLVGQAVAGQGGGYGFNVSVVEEEFKDSKELLDADEDTLVDLSTLDTSLYTPTPWVDNQTLVDAARLNKAEGQIQKNAYNINAIKGKVMKLEKDFEEVGSNTAPDLSTNFTQTIFKPGTHVKIPYYLYDAEGGNFTAVYTINGISKEVPVSIGNNEWDVGVLDNGLYELMVVVKDKKLTSRPLFFELQVGAVEVTSTFRSDTDFEFGQEIVVPYTVNTLKYEPVTVLLTIDDETTELKTMPGPQTWRINNLRIGVHRISISAKTEDAESNTVSWQIAVTNSESLFIISDFNKKEITIDERLVIPYRISMQGQTTFLVKYTIDDKIINASANLGLNSWNVGLLEFGPHTLSIIVTSTDGTSESNELVFDINVTASDFVPAKPVTDYLLCEFVAGNKDNSYDDKEEWIDTSGNGVKANLHGLNYITNGWMDGWLVLNGDAYVEIDLAPFANDVSLYGKTIDIRYKFTELNNKNAKVFSCRQPVSPYNGVNIDTQYGYLSGAGLIGKTPHIEEEDLRMTFVIDRQERYMIIYVNGVACGFVLIEGTPSFKHNSKIYLNCDVDPTGTIQNIGECSIESIRVYDKAFTVDDVLQNFQSGMTIDEQKDFVFRNAYDNTPAMLMKGSFDGMGPDEQKQLHVIFDPKNTHYHAFDNTNVLVDFQGSSSLEYAIKNYNIDLMDEEYPDEEVSIIVNDDWNSFDSYHIKANYIDSSHAQNIGFANYLSKVYKEKTPPMLTGFPKARYAIDGFPILMYHQYPEDETPKFHGVYTFNLKQHRNVLGFENTNPNHLLYRAETNDDSGTVGFNSYSIDKIKTEWELRHPKSGSDHREFSRLLQWVMESTDEEFVRDIGHHFNKNYLIDYWILCVVFGAVDSLGKNMCLGTWNKGPQGHSIWYAMFYDIDTITGTDNQGRFDFWDPRVELPRDSNVPNSLLWRRVIDNFDTEIKARYVELRDFAVTEKEIYDTFWTNIIEKVGERFYNLDAIHKYLPFREGYLHMCGGSKSMHMRKWIKERLIYTDAVFDYRGIGTDKVIVRSYTPNLMRIGIKTYTNVRITVKFIETGVGTITKECNPDTWTYFEWDYGTASLHIINISGGRYITGLSGLNDADLDMLDIQFCNRLLELEARNNPRLTTIPLQNAERISKVDISGCKGIKGTLNLMNARGLKDLNVAETSVTAVVLTNALYITNLNIRNTKLIELNLDNQQKLSSVDVSGCDDLFSISMKNCNALQEFRLMGVHSLRELYVDGCANLHTLQIDDMPTLETVSFDKCDNLESLSVRGSTVTAFDITKFNKLSYLNLENCKQLRNLIIGDESSLKTLILTNTMISALDLNGLVDELTELSVSNTPIRFVSGLKFKLLNNLNTEIFTNCSQLEVIDGYVKISGNAYSLNNTFKGCTSLLLAPELIFERPVNSMTGLFEGCSKLIEAPALNCDTTTHLGNLFKGCMSLSHAQFDDVNNNLINTEELFTDCINISKISFGGDTIKENIKVIFGIAENVEVKYKKKQRMKELEEELKCLKEE